MIAFVAETEALAAASVEEHPLGRALHDETLPEMWVFNQLQVEGPRPELTAAELAGELDRLYSRLPHRRVFVAEDATGEALAPGMSDRGFDGGALELMALSEPPAAPPEGVAREAWGEEFREAELAVAREDHREGHVAELLIRGRQRLRAAQEGTRTFLGRRESVDACTVTLYRGDGFAHVEDVSTLQAHRGHGLAAATVALAAREGLAAGAAHAVLFVAVADGPVRLYERVGFRRTGHRCWAFTRPG